MTRTERKRMSDDLDLWLDLHGFKELDEFLNELSLVLTGRVETGSAVHPQTAAALYEAADYLQDAAAAYGEAVILHEFLR